MIHRPTPLALRLRTAWSGLVRVRPHAVQVLRVQVDEPCRLAGAVRRRAVCELSNGGRLLAYLLAPEPTGGAPLPAAVVHHSTVDAHCGEPAGLAGAEGLAFGLQLARRGCIALCPRNWLWTERERGAADFHEAARAALADGCYRCGMERMLHESMLAVDALALLPGVDAGRLGCIGHSLGGKQCLYLSAFDDRIAAAVASECGVGLGMSNWGDPWYLGAAGADWTRHHDHDELLAMIAPRSFTLAGGGDADGEASRPVLAAAEARCRSQGIDPALRLQVHGHGHAVPADLGAAMVGTLLAGLQDAVRP